VSKVFIQTMTAPHRSLEGLLGEVERIPEARHYGRVATVLGMLVEVVGLDRFLSVGSRCDVLSRTGQRVPCEVVGFRNGRALAMSYGALDGVGLGCRAELVASDPVIRPTRAWLGRVVNAFGEPVDGKGPLACGGGATRIRNTPPPAHARRRVGGKLDLG